MHRLHKYNSFSLGSCLLNKFLIPPLPILLSAQLCLICYQDAGDRVLAILSLLLFYTRIINPTTNYTYLNKQVPTSSNESSTNPYITGNWSNFQVICLNFVREMYLYRAIGFIFLYFFNRFWGGICLGLVCWVLLVFVSFFINTWNYNLRRYSNQNLFIKPIIASEQQRYKYRLASLGCAVKSVKRKWLFF